LKGTRDENKSGDARGVSLERFSLERSGAGRPDKSAAQRYSNAAGEDVAGVLHDAAAVFGDCWFDNFREERPQLGMGSLFVIVYEPRTASHVGGPLSPTTSVRPGLSALAPWRAIQSTVHRTTDRTALPNAFQGDPSPS
jgi:hypothetical protein